MIAVNIKVVDIEYERTFQQIFPILKEKLGTVESKNLLIRQFQKLEKLALELLWTEESRQKLIELAQDALGKYGFAMGLADIRMMKDTEEYGDFIEEEAHLKLTDGMETDILDALAEYLRDRESGIAADKDAKEAFICGY